MSEPYLSEPYLHGHICLNRMSETDLYDPRVYSISAKRFPLIFWLIVVLVLETGQDKQKVGKSVQPDDGFFIDGLCCCARHCRPFGTAADRSGQMQQRPGPAATRKNKVFQWWKLLFESIDGRLQLLNLAVTDAIDALLDREGCLQIRPQNVKQQLYIGENYSGRLRLGLFYHNTSDSIDLIDVSTCFYSR